MVRWWQLGGIEFNVRITGQLMNCCVPSNCERYLMHMYYVDNNLFDNAKHFFHHSILTNKLESCFESCSESCSGSCFEA